MAKDILTQIVARKIADVEKARQKLPLSEIKARAAAASPSRPFLEQFNGEKQSTVNIIAEVKRASPSKGPIRPDLDPGTLAAAYTAGGAAAISVLTDTPYFRGSLDDMVAAKAAVDIPVLRKDFILSAYQIYESRAHGADAILLIARILSAGQLRTLYQLSKSLDMDVLLEIHAEAEIETARAVGARLIGINNRNLKSFQTDTQTAMRLAARLGPGCIPVAASGISTTADIKANLAAGIHSFLIGESLVQAADPTRLLQELRSGQAR
ncbi:MAG: Indole-3-glycerol phosphate synthase (EC 4.1.1.48) [Olavius algarvensis Delta 4 endosymbiont]|nr:MAG: Indole-3-glycerol phosphate synthase (EC 4.1.1.48) [Olavius algarvensis Delta 4 endosymbiont]